MVSRTKVGIDAIAVYAPELRLTAVELARARANGNAEELRVKYEKGLGVKSMAIADADEDTASMAANAMVKLMRRAEIQPKDVAAVFVATESSFDNSKPVFAYVADAIEMLYGHGTTMHIRTDERKFACISGIGALEDALNYVAVKERPVILVTSDIAKYELKSAGEPTSGAGATALLIRPNPSVLVIDPLDVAYASKNDYDFYKPFINKENSVMHGKETPTVNGHYSQYVYMAMTYKAYEDLEKGANGRGMEISGADYFVAHVPFQKMAQKGFALFLAHDLRTHNDDKWKTAEIEIGTGINNSPGIAGKSIHESLEIATAIDKLEHSLENWDHGNAYRRSFWYNAANITKLASEAADYSPVKFLSDDKAEAARFIGIAKKQADSFIADLDSFIKAFSSTSVYKEEYAKRVESGLAFSSEIGNIYTGSALMSLSSLIHNEQSKGVNLGSKSIVLIGYGSGSEAIAMYGRFAENVKPLENDIKARTNISADEYERLHKGVQEKPIKAVSDGKHVFLEHISEERIRMYGIRRD